MWRCMSLISNIHSRDLFSSICGPLIDTESLLSVPLFYGECPVVCCLQPWCAGTYQTTPFLGKIMLVCSVCWFLWCKCSHSGQFQAASMTVTWQEMHTVGSHETAAAAKLLQSCLTLCVRPCRRQPTRLLCPWDSLGKNTEVGCHFLLPCMQETGSWPWHLHCWPCTYF